ncbi:MAG TPA: hypothetical protein DHU89_01920 [Flavobacteriales bacterium]|nr:hypothetical protein [Flavobacteriales bacterium]|tara:strand:+ start:3200 stop:3760 length:561 start_codon:yes stop_codon:yes gene_type:complete
MLLKVIVLGILAASVYMYTDDALIIEKIKSNDYIELLAPVDNLIEHVTYAKPSEIYHQCVGRLSGYIFPYIIFRARLPAKSTVFLLFQFLLALSSGYFLYLLIRNSINTSIYLSSLRVITYTLFPCSVYWESIIHPYIVALLCVVIGFYLLLKSLNNSCISLLVPFYVPMDEEDVVYVVEPMKKLI